MTITSVESEEPEPFELVAPETVNLRSNGQWVTATIEVENGGAANVNRASLALTRRRRRLRLGGLPAAARRRGRRRERGSPGQVRPHGGQAMLDTALVAGLTQGSLTVEATWSFGDGSTGSASAQVRVRR